METRNNPAPIRLHPGRERRVLAGHRWVFSNEIASPLSDFEPGSWVEVFSSKQVSLGIGYINPGSLIAVRLMCRPGERPTDALFRERIQKAARLRSDTLYPGSRCHRAVFSESDGLPGLVLDQYGDVFVYQINTLGMSLLEPLLQEWITGIFRPRALVFRHDTQSRSLEGLELVKGVAVGELPEVVEVEIGAIRYRVDLLGGQKTGLFLDQRDNRHRLLGWAGEKRILDLFCYNGSWSLAAADAGASEVTGVDQSADAVAQAEANAALNGLSQSCRFIRGDVIRFLKGVPKGSMDGIIVDPPAFAKTKAALTEARKGYTDLNRRAILALKPGGMLVSCSCSYHLSEDLLRDVLLQAARASGRELRLIEARGQSMDHPVLLAMPETRYLKCWLLQVL
ncbi:MAG: class I SAM-dependent rRNA methyltransferase [Syntrophobacteraceae bacterium]